MSAVTVLEDKLAELEKLVEELEDKLAELEKLFEELVEVLVEVDEALYCASDWEVPILLPTIVKEAIAKAKGE